MVLFRAAALLFLGLLTLGSSGVRAALHIVSVDPPPGRVTDLERITVTFSAPVNGVSAGDFLVNGIPAASSFGSGATYDFFFKTPPYGPVTITWGPLHTIQDLGQPPTRFDASVAGANWNYERVDPRSPEVASILPPPGVSLQRLGEIRIQFNRPVVGVDATDLRLNGLPAQQVDGLGAGPYVFRFAPPGPGTADVSWARDTGIHAEDDPALTFSGTGVSY